MVRQWQALPSVLSLGTLPSKKDFLELLLLCEPLTGSLPISWVILHGFISLGSTMQASGGKQHTLLHVDAQHAAPHRLLVCGMNERGLLGKEEELGECYETENKGRGKTSATAKRKIRMKSKEKNTHWLNHRMGHANQSQAQMTEMVRMI